MNSSAATATPAVTVWTIDPAHSHVEFAVRHMMISTVRGRFGTVGGTVRTADDDPAKAQVDVTIDANTIDTREPQRDTHLRSADFFDVATFPEIRFTSTRVSGALAKEFTLTGNLTMHGVTREVTLHVTPEGTGTDPWGGHRTAFSATGRLKRSDFGLTWNQALEAGGVLVGDEIKISLDVELIKQ